MTDILTENSPLPLFSLRYPNRIFYIYWYYITMIVSEPLSGSSSSREQKPAQSGRNSMIWTIQRIWTMLMRTWKHQIIFLMTFLLKAITSDYRWCGYWTLLILDWVSMFSHPDLPYPFLSLWLLWNFCLWIRS